MNDFNKQFKDPKHQEHIPDQALFEPDEDVENQRPQFFKSKVWPIIRTIMATMALIGIFYFGGLYQYFLLSETPESARQEELASVLNEETLVVPFSIFVISVEGSGGGVGSSKRTEENVRNLLQNSEHIFAQADIAFDIKDIAGRTITKEEERRFLDQPDEFMRSVEGYNGQTLNIFLTRTLRGINGVAIGGTTGVVVADITSHEDFRTLAHEIGHVLGLSHTQDKTRLMAQGSFGITLTKEEIKALRNNAREMFLSEEEASKIGQ